MEPGAPQRLFEKGLRARVCERQRRHPKLVVPHLPFPCPHPLQVQLECEATGFLAITGHGISTGQLQELFAAARQLFDLATEAKMQLVVSQMKVGRGYEISPEHVRYMQVQLCRHGARGVVGSS